MVNPEPEPDSRTGAAATLSPELQQDIELWLSPNIAQRNGSLTRLLSRGPAAAHALVETMFRNASNLGRQTQLQNALREIGAPAFDVVAQALARVPHAKTRTDVSIIEDLTQTLLDLDPRRGIPVGRAQIEKLNAVPIRNRVMAELINNARLHLVLNLAEVGCTECADEAVAYLGDGSMLVPLALFDVLEKSAGPRALVPLIRLFPRQNAASEVSGRKLQEAFRAIVKRAKIGVDAPCFAVATAAEREVAEKWMKK